jgi:hypothetical protein
MQVVGIEIERGVVEVEVPQNEHKKDLPNHLQVAVVSSNAPSSGSGRLSSLLKNVFDTEYARNVPIQGNILMGRRI